MLDNKSIEVLSTFMDYVLHDNEIKKELNKKLLIRKEQIRKIINYELNYSFEKEIKGYVERLCDEIETK